MAGSSNNTSILNNSEVVKFTPKELMIKYLAYLPYFVVSLAICLGLGVAYTRYVTPVYKASTKVFIKNADDNTTSRSGNNDIIDNALFGGKQVNIDNEIVLIQSKNLLQRVVEKYQFNIQYYNEGNIKKSELYTEAPLLFMPIYIPDSTAMLQFYVKDVDRNSGLLELDKGKQIGGIHSLRFQWGKEISLGGYKFILLSKPGILNKQIFPLYVSWSPVKKTVGQIQASLQVSPFGPKATVIQLDMKAANGKRAADILDAVVSEYKLMNIEDKNKVSENTIKFITQRLESVTDELSGVENSLQGFRGEHKIIDPATQSVQFLQNANDIDKQITAIQVKQKVAGMLYDYLSKNSDKLIPSNLGVEDITLAALIAKYNELQLQRERQAPYLTKESLVLSDLNNQQQEIRNNLLENLRNVSKNLEVQSNNLREKNGEYQSVINSIPKNERALQEIKRQQNVKEGLYLYLLQKREEMAITSSSMISNYKQLEPAEASGTPIEPNVKNIRLFSIILGLLLPLSLIYVVDLFNDKVRSRDDITKRTQTPFIGEIGHVDKTHALVVADKSRSVIAEQFRILRTNLSFLIKDNKTMLITSSISGEGKSFISLNLAAVLAISGKKVALLEFDLRKPRIMESIGVVKKTVGITNFLVGQTTDATQLYTELAGYPSLHVFGSGPIPPNPAELILGDKLRVFFDWLHANYDYIIIDSAPVGLVGDSFTLAAYSDAALYIVRQRYTLKKQIDFVNDIYTSGRFKNMGLVVNDVKLGGRYGYYGYGQAYGYGGSYGYGYGGGDNYFDTPKEHWLRKIFKKKK